MTGILLAIDKTMRMTMTMPKGGSSRYNSRDNNRDSGVVVNSELLYVGLEKGQDRRKTDQDKTRQPLWVMGQSSSLIARNQAPRHTIACYRTLSHEIACYQVLCCPIEAKWTLGHTTGHNGRFMTLFYLRTRDSIVLVIVTMATGNNGQCGQWYVCM